MSEEERIPTTKRLADALRAADAPAAIVQAAEDGAYDDFKSEVEQPIINLVNQCVAAGLHDIALRAIDGEFDAQDWEADEWLHQTPEGRAVMQEFFGGEVRVKAVSVMTTRPPVFRRKRRMRRRK